MAGKKVVHLCKAEKFIPAFIEFVCAHFDENLHEFVLFGGEVDKFNFKTNERVWVLSSFRKIVQLTGRLCSAEKIIIHGLFSRLEVEFLACQPWLLKKCYWVVWGGDLYSHVLRRKNFRSDVDEWFRSFVIKRVGNLVTQVEGDYELARAWYGVSGKLHECFVYPSNLYRRRESSVRSDFHLNLLVGNSATTTNHHAEIFNKLLPLVSERVRIYCPLSYGDLDYARRVEGLGSDMFGAQFIALTDFVPFDRYLDLLASVDIAIFAHDRQQAMGNTTTLLGMGKKVYLCSSTTSWSFFQRIGAKVFDIENLNLDPIDRCDSIENERVISDYFSEKNLATKLAKIFL